MQGHYKGPYKVLLLPNNKPITNQPRSSRMPTGVTNGFLHLTFTCLRLVSGSSCHLSTSH